MNTNQNARHIYKAEDIDWNGLEAAGISKKQLETSGDMELLRKHSINSPFHSKNVILLL